MSPLLRKPGAGPLVHNVTPDAVKADCPNWAYVGFDVAKLGPGETLSRQTGELENILVIVTGKMAARAGGQDLGTLGARMDIHAREKAWSLYVPSGSDWDVTAETDLELAICAATGQGGHDIRVIAPDAAPMEARGTGATTR